MILKMLFQAQQSALYVTFESSLCNNLLNNIHSNLVFCKFYSFTLEIQNLYKNRRLYRKHVEYTIKDISKIYNFQERVLLVKEDTV